MRALAGVRFLCMVPDLRRTAVASIFLGMLESNGEIRTVGGEEDIAEIGVSSKMGVTASPSRC